MTQILDDMALDYLAMGIVDDADDITTCNKCAASIMPWFMRCEACDHDGTPALPQMWMCGECGMDDYESEYDAERCCNPLHLTNDGDVTLCGLDVDNQLLVTNNDDTDFFNDINMCIECESVLML